MTLLGFIGPPNILEAPLNLATLPKIYFFAQVPPNYFGLKFLGPPPKTGGGGCYHERFSLKNSVIFCYCSIFCFTRYSNLDLENMLKYKHLSFVN